MLNFTSDQPTGKRKGVLLFLCLFVLLMVSYSNSFDTPWHFDDFDNITANPSVHIRELTGSELRKTFHTRGFLARPVAYLSFGLNYYVGGENVFGYHVVNFILHALSSLFLFLFILETLRLPLLRERYGKDALLLAFGATLLWAVHPIHVTSVTYVVQRMSSMAGLFFILSMYGYLKGRTAPGRSRKILFYILSVLAFLLSFGSKENALVLPLVLFVYDLLLIQGADKENIKRGLMIIAAPCLLILGLGLLYRDFSSLLQGYDTRPFTLTERLLTQPRVMFFYLSLLFYPIFSRLTLLYDLETSTSLFSPPTTVLAVAAMAAVIGLACMLARRRPLDSFCILFFFLNHLLEGSFLPLEMVYEHRNYIPSMMLFVPVAIFIRWIVNTFAGKRLIRYAIVGTALFVVADLAHTTYMRNEVWRSELSLWTDNVEKSPRLSRPHALLGKTLLNEKQYPEALEEFKTAMQLKRWSNLVEPAIYECYIGNFFLDVVGDEEKAALHYTKSLEYSITHEYYAGIAMVMLKRGDLDQAHRFILEALRMKPGFAEYHNNHALVLLKKGMYDEAIESASTALALRKSYREPRCIIAEAYRQKGLYDSSISHWQEVLREDPDRRYAYLALMDLYHAAGNREALAKTTKLLLETLDENQVFDIVIEIHRRANLFAHVPNPQTISTILRGFGQGDQRAEKGKKASK